MKKISVFISAVILFVACDKDSFETKPTLKVESVSDEFIPFGQTLNVLLSFTDKEGDIDNSDSALVITRQRLNKKRPSVAGPLKYRIPTFPNNSFGDIDLVLVYNDILVGTIGQNPIIIPGTGGKFEPDTLLLGFFIRDKKNNISDTAHVTVIVERQ